MKPYEITYSPDEITTKGEHLIIYNLMMSNAGTMDQNRTFSVTLDPNLSLENLFFFIGGISGPIPAKPQMASAKYGWSFVLPPNKSALVQVIAKVNVQEQATSFTTIVDHSDGVNPLNDVSIPLVTLNHAVEWISHYFPLITH